jgi:hypothetical protein
VGTPLQSSFTRWVHLISSAGGRRDTSLQDIDLPAVSQRPLDDAAGVNLSAGVAL